ncbi:MULTISPECIES: dynamin family protein [Thioclava]|uniref:Dynamin N-terminal domain-containing protein n=1 Tax=Thioclava electrotropha TaxID=1549850 RepID=A0ABX6YUC2_9RHOB|nr:MULTISPECIES: dynamin family protein [Thioclava]OOY30504.1 hypothetical protein BMI88_15140 [Thioclava sp. F36-6]QPZ91452.1 hypothetical protein AKL02_011435 [Thioclava electrotropha]
MKIAPQLRKELDFLNGALDRIEASVERSARPRIRDLRLRLHDWAARVAVIGQVKAGKSTFLNAFLHQHDFLPSDVNPWTSVVTNMRINLPEDPVTGARFEFFSEADWDEIINGGTRIRKLTEELLPGFDTDILREQSEQMRRRAQRRLGKHYQMLLGQHHDYDFLAPDLLQRYVCAGPGADDGLEREALGRYAALTKSANIYMRLPEFQVPTIITDTPGVNDPFLVRDEFTCRSLDRSDVFIMVLSAHQPLTDVDLALIRILAKQDDKDVLIFLNRIDELDDYAVEVPRVIADVSRRLRAAIPDIDFKIVAGSAYLADLTQRSDEEAAWARAEMDSMELAQYLYSRFGRVPEDPIDRLLLASGVEEVKHVLSAVIDGGVGRQQLAQLRGDLRAELSGMQFVARRERDTLQMQIESIRSDVAEAAIEEMSGEIAATEALRGALENHVESAEHQIEAVLNRGWSALETRLNKSIEDFVLSQRDRFEDVLRTNRIRDGRPPRSFETDTTALQIALEREVTKSYARSRAAIDVLLDNAIHACRTTVADRFDDPSEEIDLSDMPHDTFTSTLTLTRRALRINFALERGWAFWRGPTVNIEKTLDGLRIVAAEELRPAVEKILQAYGEALVERASAGGSRLRVMVRMMEMIVRERTLQLKQERAELERLARDPQMQSRLASRIQSKLEVLERRLINLGAIESAVSSTMMPRRKPATRAA